jgi:hypothetical protein
MEDGANREVRIPFFTMETLFIGLVLALYVYAILNWKNCRKNWALAFVLFVWLGVLAGLSLKGFFRDFTTLPPRIAFAILPPFVLFLVAAFHPKTGQALSSLAPRKLVLFQSFRIVMEVILYVLVAQRRLPEILSVTGSNFDVLVGVTAPPVGYFWLKPGHERVGLVQLWNLLGLAILFNTVIHGILAVPTPFQVFHTDPPNTLVAEFPWIWLPGFVVPIALMGHVLSIRQLSALK